MSQYDFKKLTVWQRAMELAKSVYRYSGQFPASEMYGLSSQMRRSVVSIASNIAEGKKRSSKKEFMHFLRVADGSAGELETQFLLAREIFKGLPGENEVELLLSETQRMLTGLIVFLK